MIRCVSVYCEFLGEWSSELIADGYGFVNEVISKFISS